MSKNKKKWLSDYKPKLKRKGEKPLSTREILRTHNRQLQEVRIFLKGEAKKRRNERPPYEKRIEVEG